MARISYVDLADITDPEMRKLMEDAILNKWSESHAVYAQSPVVFKYFRRLTTYIRTESTLGADLWELVRVRVATSWERMFKLQEAGQGCHY